MMGKKGNKARQDSRRSLVARVQAKEYLDAKTRAEEQMELEEAYGVPWDEMEDKEVVPKKEKEVAKAENNKFRVTILKDHKLEYPDLNLQIYLACSEFDKPGFTEMFTRSRCMKAPTLEEADLVVFGGGPDVDPSYYGITSKHPSTRPNLELDQEDMETYLRCYYLGIPMVGICRGAQFLHVQNGGMLYQDVDNHNRCHAIVDKNTKQLIQRCSSVHHQMCYSNQEGGMEIIATAGVSRNRWLPTNVKDIQGGQIEDIEAFFYRDTACLGFQGHPEYKGYNFYTQWCLSQIEDYILNNPDLRFRTEGESQGYYRLQQELLDIRDNVKTEEVK